MMFNVDHVRMRKPWVSVVMFVYLEVKGHLLRLKGSFVGVGCFVGDGCKK